MGRATGPLNWRFHLGFELNDNASGPDFRGPNSSMTTYKTCTFQISTQIQIFCNFSILVPYKIVTFFF